MYIIPYSIPIEYANRYYIYFIAFVYVFVSPSPPYGVSGFAAGAVCLLKTNMLF